MTSSPRLSVADLQALSRLLDEGLAMGTAQRDAWLADLPAEAAHLRERLRALLATELSPQGPLGALPAIDEPAPAALAGETLGPYRLLRLLGRGGMGEVWLAERCDGSFERQVALKLPRRTDSTDAAAALAGRLRQEVRLVARLEHPQIARLYEAGSDALGRPYIAMEHVLGRPLDQAAATLSLAERLRLFQQVLRAVDFAHAREVVHLDLKPAHVLVDADGAPHLLDFGIASLLGPTPDAASATATPGLTPRYAAPEQRAGRPPSVQADVYALGVMLAELIAPHAASADLQAIVDHARAADPAQRYADVHSLAEDLARLQRGQPVGVRPRGPLSRLALALRRQPGARMLGMAVLALALLSAGLYGRQQRDAQAADERERQVREFMAALFRLGGSAAAPAAGASDAKAVRWLDDSSRLIRERFARQPELQAELFGLVATGYADMGAPTLAAQSQEQRLLALRAAGAAPQTLRPALLDAAQAEIERRLPQQAEALLAQARALAPDDARLHLLMAWSSLGLGHIDAARQSLHRWDGAPSADAAQRARVQALRAELQLQAGQADEALATLQAAIEQAPGLLAAELRLRAAQWAVELRRNELAERLFGEARSALLAAGGLHRIRAAVATAWFWNLLSGWSALEPLELRIAELEAMLADLLAQGDAVPSLLIADMEAQIGSIHLNRGHLQRARPLIERGLALRLANVGSPLERVQPLGVAAGVAMDSGRHELGDRLYRARMQARQDAGRGRHFLVANDRRWVALNASMAGRTQAALQVLDEAPALSELTHQGPEPGWYERTLNEARARVLLDAGQAGQALALLTPRPPGRQDHALFGVPTAPQWLRAEARCRLRPDPGALHEMRQFLQALPASIHPQAPQLARLRALAADCAWRVGQRTEARAWAHQAGEALNGDAEISPYFRAPWLALPAELRRSGFRPRAAPARSWRRRTGPGARPGRAGIPAARRAG